MKARTVAWVAWLVWAVLAGLAILLQALSREGISAGALGVLPLGSFMTVGAVVVSRQPRNTVGWLCCVAGLLGTLGGLAEEYARYALGPQGGALPGGLVMAWLTLWVGALWVGLVFTLLLLLVSHWPAPVAALASGRLGQRSQRDGRLRRPRADPRTDGTDARPAA
jgi:hypothetical protein